MEMNLLASLYQCSKNLLHRVHSQHSLVVKVLCGLILFQGVIWVGLDVVQSRRFQSLVTDEFAGKLSHVTETQEILLDRYLRSLNALAKVISVHRPLVEYVAAQHKVWDSNDAVHVYENVMPLWLPSSSLLRAFDQFAYMLLFDSHGDVKECFQNTKNAIPVPLLSRSLMQKMSMYGENIMELDGTLVHLVSQTIGGDDDREWAHLVLVSPIDRNLLVRSQVVQHEDYIMALMRQDAPYVFASTDEKSIPLGPLLPEVGKEFLVGQHKIFDYGTSEIPLRLVMFYSREKTRDLIGTILRRSREHRAIMAVSFFLGYLVIIYVVLGRIRKLFVQVSGMTKNISGQEKRSGEKGDELNILEKEFLNYAKAVNVYYEELEKRAQQLLNEKNKMQKFFDVVGVAMMYVDVDGVIIDVNKRAEEMLQRSKKMLVGESLIAIFIGEDEKDKMQKFVDEIRCKDNLSHGFTESQIVLFSGKKILIAWTAAAIKDADARAQGILMSAEDITDRRLYEKELKKSNDFVRNILDSINEAICIINVADYSIVDCNRVYLNSVGYQTKGEVFGKKCYQAAHRYENACDKNGHVCLMHAVVSTHIAATTEQCICDAEGKKQYFEISVYPLVCHDNQVTQVIHSAKDITFRKETEKRQKQLERDLAQSQKLESVGILAAGVAHEINTPIQFIDNNTQFIKKAIDRLLQLIESYRAMFLAKDTSRDTDDRLSLVMELEKKSKLQYLKDEVQNAIAQSQEGLHSVSKIVSAMKDFSHVGAEEKSLEDINQAIQSVIAISRNEWKYVADILQELSSSLPPVKCFIGEIKQVILNLVVNAAHTIKDAQGGENSQKGVITIRTYADDTHAFITVTDTGTGIPENIRNRVFDHFFTTKEVGKGTGQGLSIAYSCIVEKHKGDLTFETEVGQGTTFIIKLPIAGE